MVGSHTCRRFGRKATMVAGGACFLAGTVLVTLAVHMSMLVLGRLVLGVGVGFATQVSCKVQLQVDALHLAAEHVHSQCLLTCCWPVTAAMAAAGNSRTLGLSSAAAKLCP